MTKDPEYLPDWISTAQAADLLGVSRVWVTKLIHAGELEATKLNPRAWLVSRASTERLLAARLAEKGEQPKEVAL